MLRRGSTRRLRAAPHTPCEHSLLFEIPIMEYVPHHNPLHVLKGKWYEWPIQLTEQGIEMIRPLWKSSSSSFSKCRVATIDGSRAASAHGLNAQTIVRRVATIESQFPVSIVAARQDFEDEDENEDEDDF